MSKYPMGRKCNISEGCQVTANSVTYGRKRICCRLRSQKLLSFRIFIDFHQWECSVQADGLEHETAATRGIKSELMGSGGVSDRRSAPICGASAGIRQVLWRGSDSLDQTCLIAALMEADGS